MKQELKKVSNSLRHIAEVNMDVPTEIIGSASEGAILKFVLSLWELSHPGKDAVKEAVSILGMDKGAFIQHKNGKGSIGIEGWEMLRAKFDLRPYDIWCDCKRKQYETEQ
jgi:hypothetical protein